MKWNFNEKEKKQYNKTLEVVKESGVHRLPGYFVDVDILQVVLEELGYIKGSLGSEDIWYENVVGTINGYVAKMETVSPDNKTHQIIVDALYGNPMVNSVS